MKAVYTAVATSVGGRSGSVRSSDGVLNFEIKPPKEMGGPGGNYTNPEQLFAAGYAACFGSALSHVSLAKNKTRINPEVVAKVTMFEKDGGGFQLGVEIDVNLPGMEKQDAEQLVKEAHQMCPYSNATRNNIEVDLKVTTEKR